MSDQPHAPLNRRELERIADAAVGRQLRLLVGLSALLLVLGFVVGQFTGASLARRNTQRLQAQLDEVERTLESLEFRLAEQQDAHDELENALVRVERQRRNEIDLDRQTLQVLIDNVEAARNQVHADLDEFVATSRTVPAFQVRRMVDRFVSEQVQSIEQLVRSQFRRLGRPEQTKVAATGAAAPTEGIGPRTSMNRERAAPELDRQSPSAVRDSDESSDIEAAPVQIQPPACRPKQEVLAGGRPAAAANRDQSYLSPPRRHGLLFITPSQPGRIDPTRVSDSESIPLPPR